MSEDVLIDVQWPVVSLKLDFAQKLFDNIPSNIVDRWELKKPEKNINRSSIFRFNKQKLSKMYYHTHSENSIYTIIKYSFPDFKFEYIYSLKEKDVNYEGHPIERRYDKDENMESEYVKIPNKKGGYLTVKTKSKDKEVYLPYVWGEDPKPLDNIDEIRPYLVETPTQLKWFHKEDNPEDMYVTFLLNTPFFK